MSQVKLNITLPSGASAPLPPATKPKRKRGQPRKFQTVQHLETVIEEFFEDCVQQKRVPSKASMALFLDTTKETLQDYESGKYDDDKSKYSFSIKRAYSQIEAEWVNLLARPSPAVGSIFYLKNAFHYRDTHDVTSGGQPINFTIPAEIAIKHQLQLPPNAPPIDGNKDVKVIEHDATARQTEASST